MNLKNKLLVLVLIPLLCLLLFAVRTVAEKNSQVREMNALADLATVSARIGALVHELQKERGMSAGFIGSKGANFAAELPRQREEVTKRQAELDRQLAAFDAAAYGGGLQEYLAAAGKLLSDLAATRKAVTAFDIGAPQAIAYYTNTIGALLAVVGQTASLSGDADVTRLAAAYDALLQAKESAGLERAVLSNVMGADKFTPDMLVRFLSVSASEDTWLKVFQVYASPDQAGFFKRKLAGPAVDEVRRIKQAALEKMNEPSLAMDAKYWFAKSTERIDLLKDVENRLAADLTETAERLQREAHRLVVVYMTLSMFAILLTAFAAFRLIRGILGQIGGEPADAVRIARAIAGGKLDNDIDLRPGDSESLLCNMKSMQAQLRDRIEAERVTANANLRIRIALDNVSTGVMIADSARHVIYANKSVQGILKGAETGMRQRLPQFDADRLVGVSLDAFHDDPAQQARLFDTLTGTHAAKLMLGDRHMTVTANPVVNEQGDRLGTVAEWLDRTDEVRVEEEVQHIVAAAARGEFDARIDTQDKEGFFAKLGEEINMLLDNTQQALNATSEVLDLVAHGDLTRTIDRNYHGILGRLKDDTNTTVERLRQVVGRIKEAADAIDTASREIAAGNQDLSSRTEEQASSLEETASSMEQLNATVKQNAENARQANELAGSSNELAVRGGEMVKRVVATMSEIQDSSHKIADIIGVIDSIAFQTNILALNAAVEAARAGEQGRGFAVVATEVRNLAQRSATAAKEIKTLIAASVSKVEGGARLVQEAGSTMDGVVTSFQRVAALVTEIANASREQSSGIEQVTQAVGQMDEATQQNAALVEQAAAAAESLEEQASSLVQEVGSFRLVDDPRSASASHLPGPALRDATPRQLPNLHSSAASGRRPQSA
ncbi:MAG: methyl-accepting chemotaxis protein [Rhodocyclaceae bacterium]|nr:methyl-accepting chemotaxis protein [Rhodocyclaceae bacterium]